MAYLDLDKIINVNWWGGWWTYPDNSPYPVLWQSIWLFNKDDAWDWWNSEWRFWLLNSSNNNINAQNNSWNTQYSPAISQGTGALSTKVKSYAFSADIDTIDSWSVIAWLYRNIKDYSVINIDENTQDIISVYWTNNLSSIYSKKAYIVSAWWNQFFCKITWENEISVYDAWVWGEPIWNPIDTQNIQIPDIVTYWSTADRIRSSIVWTNWDYLYVIIWRSKWSAAVDSNGDDITWFKMSAFIYQVQSNWTLSLIDSSIDFKSIENQSFWHYNWWYATLNIWTYQIWTTWYLLISWWSEVIKSWSPSTYNSARAFWLFSYDLTSTTVSLTEEYYVEWSDLSDLPEYMVSVWTNDDLIFWYDWSKWIVVDWNLDIQNVDSSWIVDSSNDYFALNALYWCRYRNTITKLTSQNLNVFINDNKITAKWQDVDWVFTWLYNNYSMVFEMDWSSEEDDSWVFKWYYINTTASIKDTSNVELSFNSTVVDSISIQSNMINVPTEFFLSFSSFWWNVMSSPDIELEIKYANSNSLDTKLWFNLTWGDYATPIWSNDLSWDATTPRTPWANSTYLNLTLTA